MLGCQSGIFTGSVQDRFSSSLMLWFRWGGAIMGLSVTPLVLVAGLFFMSVGYAALDVAGNAKAVAIENHLQKRYVTSFHGM